MIDLDKFLYFNCPDECGQLAIPCSLRMILNNDVFFCEACGCEFQVSVYPQWLPNAVCAENDSNSMIHKDIMVVLYSYLYGNGPCPAENVISQLLQADLNLWTLFPIDKIAIQDLLNLLESKDILAVFEFSSLNSGQIVELLSKRPDYAEKCNLTELSSANWINLICRQPQFAKACPWNSLITSKFDRTVEIMPEISEQIFQNFPYKNDSRFIQKKSKCSKTGNKNIPGSIDNFFAAVDCFNFYKHVEWKHFSAADLLPLFKKNYRILQNYPFTNTNLKDFDWNSFSSSDWEAIKSANAIQPALMSIYNLYTGKKVAAILKKDPALYKYCNWNKIKSAGWRDLLITFPKIRLYWQHCNWNCLRAVDWRKILDNGKNRFAIAVYNALHGQKISTLLKDYPDVFPYIAWDKIEAADWLELLSENPQYAQNCDWYKIYEYIKNLPLEKKQSIKHLNHKLWERRAELLSFVDSSKIQTLPEEQYYSILDFFDWEEYLNFASLSSDKRISLFIKYPQFCESYGVENLTSQEKIDIAIHSKAFGERYGWNLFTDEELTAIVEAQPDYLTYFAQRSSLRKILRKLANSNEEFASQYKLNFFDYLLFRKFESLKLSSKITFLWHFIISLAGFAGFLYLVWDGPCGLLALYKQSKSIPLLFMTAYAGLAIFWSYIHARLFSGRTPFLLTIISALSGVLLINLPIKYTFFLSNFSSWHYKAFGGIVVALVIMIFIKIIKKELFFFNKSGLKLLSFVYLPAMLLIFFTGHPFNRDQKIKLSEQLQNSPRPFYSAADYYLQKALQSDDEAKKTIASIRQALENHEYDKCRELLSTLPQAYSRLPEIKKLDSDLRDKLQEMRKTLTMEVIKAYKRGDFKQVVKGIYSSDFDNKEIQFILGKCFHVGLGEHKIDYKKAVEWYRKAVLQKHPGAMVNLGNLYWEGKGIAKDYTMAVELYRDAAEQNLAQAQLNLGVCYLYGIGIKQNYTEAVKYFSKAANQNDAESQALLGMCYYYGYGIKKNYAEALKWLNKGAAQNNIIAQLYLGIFYFEGNGTKKDYQKATEWFSYPANSGNSLAQLGLGLCFFNTKNYENAVKWFYKAALQKNAQAQGLLGECYFSGYGVEKNYNEAVKWLRQSVEQGNDEAMVRLGICYYYGYGVTKNHVEAIKWLREAKKHGNKSAETHLKKLFPYH